MKERPRETTFRTARWNPRWGDIWPLLTWIAVGGFLQLARLSGSGASMPLAWLNPIADLTFLIVPVIAARSSGGLSFLGITRKRLGLGLIVGGVLAVIISGLTLITGFLSGISPALPSLVDTIAYLLRTVFHVAAIELFYRGWAAARFERSYGVFPAIIISGLLYSLSYLFTWGMDPTTPAAALPISYYWTNRFFWFLAIGVFLAGLVRFTGNLVTSFTLVFVTTVIGELMPGGPAHNMEDSGAVIVGTLALSGIVAVVLWLSGRRNKKTK